MGFFKVDKDKAARKGSVYVASVGKKMVIGRGAATTKIAAVVSIAANHVTSKGHLPEVTVLKFKKTPNTYAAESLLHSLLCDCKSSKGDFYEVSLDRLESVWGEI